MGQIAHSCATPERRTAVLAAPMRSLSFRCDFPQSDGPQVVFGPNPLVRARIEPRTARLDGSDELRYH